MIEVELSVNLEALRTLFSVNSGLAAAALPNTLKAFSDSQHIVSQAWKDYLNKESPLDGIDFLEKTNRSMADSVKEKTNSEFDRSVYSDNVQLAEAANGSPEVRYDMKKTHPYGKKSRVSSKGIPYLIIPFRWGTPNQNGTKRRWANVIPKKQYNLVLKGFQMSERAADSMGRYTHIEKNAAGELIPRSNYSWKSRLSAEDSWEETSKHGRTYTSEGMVRMKDVKKSTYWTFRIISAASPEDSWIYRRDGKPPVDIIRALERTLGDTIRNRIESALKADEENLKS